MCGNYALKHWMVDPFHVKNHVEPKCLLGGEYHPGNAKHIALSQSVNLEVH